jgi:uncharacterized protein YjiS (DUF1127 family)
MRKPSRNKAARRLEIDAYARHALATNGFGDAAVDPPAEVLPKASRQRMTARRSDRPDSFSRLLHALARRIALWWKRRQEAGATYVALAELDARTLRDIGLHPSEISSIALEAAGNLRPTRVRSSRTTAYRFR